MGLSEGDMHVSLVSCQGYHKGSVVGIHLLSVLPHLAMAHLLYTHQMVANAEFKFPYGDNALGLIELGPCTTIGPSDGLTLDGRLP